MTRAELAALVPIYHRNGRLSYVNLIDIPPPWRDQFGRALRGSQLPIIDGHTTQAAYAHDWLAWLSGLWHEGADGPQGLD